MVKKNCDYMLSRFHLITERNGHTDGRTDRFAISISRVSMLTRDKNDRVNNAIHTSRTFYALSQFQPNFLFGWQKLLT